MDKGLLDPMEAKEDKGLLDPMEAKEAKDPLDPMDPRWEAAPAKAAKASPPQTKPP